MRGPFFLLILMLASPALAQEQRLVMLGDSLTSGYGLETGQDLPTQLQQELEKLGLDVKVENAGVGGDTTAGGLSRVEWATGGTRAPALVIVGLGGNDLLRGIDPATSKANLAAIIEKLQASNLPVLLLGMRAPTNLGPDFIAAFDGLYPDLAERYKIPLYPFLLEGVAMVPELNQADGIHPNAQGVKKIATALAPAVKSALTAP
jgi:acyl-CoA thioesterase-1